MKSIEKVSTNVFGFDVEGAYEELKNDPETTDAMQKGLVLLLSRLPSEGIISPKTI